MNLTKKEHKNARTKPARHAPNNNGMGSEVKDSNVSTDKGLSLKNKQTENVILFKKQIVFKLLLNIDFLFQQ